MIDIKYASDFWHMLPSLCRLILESLFWISLGAFLITTFERMMKKVAVHKKEKDEELRHQGAPQYLSVVTSKLVHLEDELQPSLQDENALKGLIVFMQRAMSFCDLELDMELLIMAAPVSGIQKFQKFRLAVCRNQYGTNRTRIGDTVSAESIFLTVEGLPERSLAYYINLELHGAEDALEFKAVCEAANRFMCRERKLLSEIIEEFDLHGHKVVPFNSAA